MSMHPDEIENWERIREHMEALGNTDNYFYRRAVAIGEGKPDPMPYQKPLAVDEDTAEPQQTASVFNPYIS